MDGNNYVVVYPNDPKVRRAFINLLEATDINATITDFDKIEITFYCKERETYRNKSIITLAHLLGDPIKISYSTGELIWEMPSNVIIKKSSPVQLNEDILNIIAGNLDDRSRSYLREASTAHGRQIKMKQIQYSFPPNSVRSNLRCLPTYVKYIP